MMNLNRHQPAKECHSAVILILFMTICQFTLALGQSPTRAREEFDNLAQAYHSNRITAEQYFVKADSLTHQLLAEGKHFETKELVDLLALYEKIAWSKAQYGRARVSYFFLFFNNARMFKKRGASIYYAEKVSEEYKRYGEEHPLVEQLQKSKIYQELRLYREVIEIFEGERSYLTGLPDRLQTDQIDHSVGLNALYILSPVLMGYIRLKDTASVYQTADLANRIGSTLRRKELLSRSQMLYNDMLMIDIALSVANFEQRYDDANSLLNDLEGLKTTYKDQATSFIDVNLNRLRIENYINLQNQDSLRAYIEKYESSTAFGDSQRADIAEFKGKLWTLEGNYREAYLSLADALQLERDVQADVMAESSNLLYAYTQAEHSGIALQKAESVKQQRTTWLLIISFVAIIIILAIYLTMLRQSRKAKEQVEALNNAADMQIIAMEEAKHQAVREEQQRLGQDLHDGLSSSIASIRHQLELLSMDTDDAFLKHKLGTLQTTVTTAYETARNKSHEWFNAANDQEEQSFEQRIRLLTERALPDSRYQKNIQIDDHSLLRVNADTRIALLRIIQEAITNIIKHARAKQVGILIYEEMDNLVLFISDDGKGLGQKKPDNEKSTMGLLSIRRRANYLNGEVTIQSDTNGTEITVSIPLVPL
ncbi:Signal transduction histidine kinase [Parapedobacter luteus]|uniref:histidine kinase n=1 Tax=Parapedobacter luteus TaxID=623280 RepID=A0A1T5DVK2_9SPHI|nr:ATP-binding protein [Parapedobacter luteus]SKB75681.1 Signal transduction histidine kinase [Parapedobacter luteus]